MCFLHLMIPIKETEGHYPKSASWLNMVECEIAIISRLCLNRRIPTQAQLEDEVLALLQERHTKEIRINWQFSITSARSTLNRHYSHVHPDNENLKET